MPIIFSSERLNNIFFEYPTDGILSVDSHNLFCESLAKQQLPGRVVILNASQQKSYSSDQLMDHFYKMAFELEKDLVILTCNEILSNSCPDEFMFQYWNSAWRTDYQPFYCRFDLDTIKQGRFLRIREESFNPITCNAYSEKVMFALAHAIPFVVDGLKGCLDLIHRDGFQTFSEVINEDYNNLEDSQDRKTIIEEELNKICNLSASEWANLYKYKIHPQISHNLEIAQTNYKRKLKVLESKLLEIIPEPVALTY